MNGLQSHSQTLSKNELVPKEGYGYCLVDCSRCDPILFPESWWNNYGSEILSTNRRNWSIEKSNSSSLQCSPTCRTTIIAEIEKNWGTKVCLIRHTHQTFCQLIIVFSNKRLQILLRWQNIRRCIPLVSHCQKYIDSYFD